MPTPPSRPARPAAPPAAIDPLRPLALELRHLRLVLAIVEQGGVTRAAERLHLTQPALSHSLREIEARLGVPLFLRVRNRLVLTDAGGMVLAAAQRTLGELVALETELRDRADGRRGVIRLTTECYTCYEWLPPLLGRFERRFPQVAVEIVVDATPRALPALREGKVDLALVTTAPAAARDLALRPLFEDELLLLVAPDHRLAHRKFVRPADLVDERLILYSPKSTSLFYQRFLQPAGAEPREMLEVQLTEAIVSMVKAGLGVTALARWAVAGELRRGTVVGVRLGPSGMRRTWRAAMRGARAVPEYLEVFIGMLAADAEPGRFEQRRMASGA